MGKGSMLRLFTTPSKSSAKVKKEAEGIAKKVRLELEHRITALQVMAKRLEETQQTCQVGNQPAEGILH